MRECWRSKERSRSTSTLCFIFVANDVAFTCHVFTRLFMILGGVWTFPETVTSPFALSPYHCYHSNLFATTSFLPELFPYTYQAGLIIATPRLCISPYCYSNERGVSRRSAPAGSEPATRLRSVEASFRAAPVPTAVPLSTALRVSEVQNVPWPFLPPVIPCALAHRLRSYPFGRQISDLGRHHSASALCTFFVVGCLHQSRRVL